MIIAAVDVSYSIRWVENYVEKVNAVLHSLTPPVRIIFWSHFVSYDATFESEVKSVLSLDYADGKTKPQCFVRLLPADAKLYIFTDGNINQTDVDECRAELKERNVLLSKVCLHYLGPEQWMNTRFTDLFRGVPQEIHINEDYVGRVETELPDLDEVDYDDIMRDDTFKATVMNRLRSLPDETAREALKIQLNALTSRVLRDRFGKKHSIGDFHARGDVEGCVAFVKKHSYRADKAAFQRKMSDILNLFDKNCDTYSLHHFKRAAECAPSIEDADDSSEGEEGEEEELPCAYLTCDILYEKCDIVCIPVKKCLDDVWLDKKMLSNPFRLLESERDVRRIANNVEPRCMDYERAYGRLPNPDVSPFSRDVLKGVYLLHHRRIDDEALVRHNNYVLSTFFQNRLPGKSVLWHAVFLYVLATRRFPEDQALFFEEIRYLGDRASYFVTLNPHLNPPFVDTLNRCFWYVARVCPAAFPNNKKNVLRREDFVSGAFLEFYRAVYEPEHAGPEAMPAWQLWYALCRDRRAIFSVLSRYYRHEEVKGPEKYSPFGTVLYREKEETTLPDPKFSHLHRLSVGQVWRLYAKISENKSPDFYRDLSGWEDEKPAAEPKLDGEEGDDLLSHIEINAWTCHPYVTCRVTGKHWKECLGPYDVTKDSYLRLFKRYCQNYKQYPKSGENLMCFLNEYLYTRNDRIPELFFPSLKTKMNSVVRIFTEVRKLFTCEQYLKWSDFHASEKFREQFDSLPSLICTSLTTTLETASNQEQDHDNIC